MPTLAVQKHKPNPQQLAFIELLADPGDFRSISEKAVEVGYEASYGRHLAADPTFSEWVLERAREMVRSRKPAIYRELVQDATTHTDGDSITRHRAARLIFQATGEIKPATPHVTINDNRQVVLVGFSDKLSALFSERRAQLQEVGVVEARADQEDGARSKKPKRKGTNGNGHSAE
jgi:hypothetical protein